MKLCNSVLLSVYGLYFQILPFCSILVDLTLSFFFKKKRKIKIDQFFFFFKWPHSHHMEVPKPGIESELQL